MNNIIIVTNAISIWIIFVIVSFVYISIKGSVYFPIGPNPQLYILQIPINTPGKYIGVVIFCFSNSIFRSLHHNIIQSWITNNIQDENNMEVIDIFLSHKISCISTIYTWLDFFLYMHILMSQLDLLFVEVIADVLMTIIITKYYLDKKQVEFFGKIEYLL